MASGTQSLVTLNWRNSSGSSTAIKTAKWDTTGPPIVKRVSFENPMYIQERVTGHESRRGVRQSAATSTERLKARSNAIEKRIFDASDEGEEDEDTDMEGDVSQLLDALLPPRTPQATPRTSVHPL